MGNGGKSPVFGLFLLFSMLFLTVTFSSIPTASAIDVGILPFEIAINEGLDRAYVSHADGFVHVIKTTDGTLVTTTFVGPGALLGITVDPATDKIYVVNSGANEVIVLSGATNLEIASIDLLPFGGIFPVDVEVSSFSSCVRLNKSKSIYKI